MESKDIVVGKTVYLQDIKGEVFRVSNEGIYGCYCTVKFPFTPVLHICNVYSLTERPVIKERLPKFKIGDIVNIKKYNKEVQIQAINFNYADFKYTVSYVESGEATDQSCYEKDIECIKPELNILVLVDCQNDFIDGSLGVGYDRWIKAFECISKHAQSSMYDRIVVTKDCHPYNHCSFKEQGGKWESHCLSGSYGEQLYWKLNEILSDKETTVVLKGIKPDIEEYGVDLYEKMNINPSTHTVNFFFMGLCLDYCVSACAKLTAEHDNCKCFIMKDGCVAIDENAKIDAGKAEILTKVAG